MIKISPGMPFDDFVAFEGQRKDHRDLMANNLVKYLKRAKVSD
jgi:hypothetical protein